MVHTWAEDNVKYDKHDVEPVHILLSGSEGTCKSRLVKVIYNAIAKTLLYHCKEPKKPIVIDSSLELMFMTNPEIAFAGFSVMTVADLLQLPPFKGKFINTNFLIRIVSHTY